MAEEKFFEVGDRIIFKLDLGEDSPMYDGEIKDIKGRFLQIEDIPEDKWDKLVEDTEYEYEECEYTHAGWYDSNAIRFVAFLK